MKESTLSYLESMAPLKNFLLYRGGSVRPGLIHYRTEDGAWWTLLEDDDVRFDEAIRLLEAVGCPIIDNIEELNRIVARGHA